MNITRRYANDKRLQNSMNKLVGNKSESIFSETYSQQVEMALRKSESLGAVLDGVTVGRPFTAHNVDGGAGDSITSQFKQTARVIKARTALKRERDVFFLSHGSFDTHSDLLGKLDELFQYVNGGRPSPRASVCVRVKCVCYVYVCVTVKCEMCVLG